MIRAFFSEVVSSVNCICQSLFIKTNPTHKRATKTYPESPEWQLIYSQRTSVERVFACLKAHRKLNSLRVRGINKVRIHCLLSVTALQAQVLATRRRASVRRIIGLTWPTKQLAMGRLGA